VSNLRSSTAIASTWRLMIAALVSLYPIAATRKTVRRLKRWTVVFVAVLTLIGLAPRTGGMSHQLRSLGSAMSHRERPAATSATGIKASNAVVHPGQATLPDVSISKKPAQTCPASLTDNFTRSSLDTSLWTSFDDGVGSTVSARDGHLKLALANSAQSARSPIAGIMSICTLPNDFDLRVSYSLPRWPTDNGTRFGLTLSSSILPTLPGEDAVERVSHGGPDTTRGEVYLADFGGDNVLNAIATNDRIGQLRLVRTGTVLTAFYFGHSSWVQIYSGRGLIGDVHFELKVWGPVQHNIQVAINEVSLTRPLTSQTVGPVASSLLPSTPAGGYALHFNGHDDAVLDSYNLVGESGNGGGTADYTIELWVNPAPYQRPFAAVMSTFDDDPHRTHLSYGAGYVLEQDYNNTNEYVWTIGHGDQGQGTNSPVQHTPPFRISAGSWHHVAIVYQQSQQLVSVYVDGRRRAQKKGFLMPFLYAPQQPLYLGTTQCCYGQHDDRHWAGTVDDLRISRTPRYSGKSFSPPRHAFVADGATIALYSFDEGDGQYTASDTAYNNYPGTPFTGDDTAQPSERTLVHRYGPSGGFLDCARPADFSGACPPNAKMWVTSPLPPAPLALLHPPTIPEGVVWDPPIATDGAHKGSNPYPWMMSVQVSKGQGLVLRDVRLGMRYMAQDMGVAYVTVTTSRTGSRGYTARLTPTDDGPGHSRLVNFRIVNPGNVIEGGTGGGSGNALNILATYEINIPLTSSKHGASTDKLFITQRYEFLPTIKERDNPDKACEASQDPPVGRLFFPGLTCAIFRPTIHYVFVGTGGDKLTSVQIAQRLVFTPDQKPLRGFTVIHDCAVQENGTHAQPCNFPITDNPLAPNCLTWTPKCLPIKAKADPPPLPDCLDFDLQHHKLKDFLPCKAGPGVQLKENQDPLTKALVLPIIHDGAMIKDPTTHHPWDNLHLTSDASGMVSPPIPSPPGCEECVHFHWRWDAYFGNPRYGHGHPLIPQGSRQDVTIAVVPAQPCESSPIGEGPGCDDAVVHSLTDIRVRANQPLNNRGLVMWYIATGRTPEDVFFAHGGFFDPDGAYHPCSGDPNCPAMMWTSPRNHFFAHRKKHLFFSALQRRTQSSHPDIAYVRFTYRTRGGEWQPACLAKPGHDSCH